VDHDAQEVDLAARRIAVQAVVPDVGERARRPDRGVELRDDVFLGRIQVDASQFVRERRREPRVAAQRSVEVPEVVAGAGEPRTAPVELQNNESNVASTRMSTVLWISCSQMFAAASKTLRRCLPSVLPSLPPTGLRDDLSLKPRCCRRR
jgi:hypothetical protein